MPTSTRSMIRRRRQRLNHDPNVPSLLLDLPWEIVLAIANQLPPDDLRSLRLSNSVIAAATKRFLYSKANLDVNRHCLCGRNDSRKEEWAFVRDLTIRYHDPQTYKYGKWMENADEAHKRVFKDVFCSHPACMRFLLPLMNSLPSIEVLKYDVFREERPVSLCVDDNILARMAPKLRELRIGTIFFPRVQLLEGETWGKLTRLEVNFRTPDRTYKYERCRKEVFVTYIANLRAVIASAPKLRALKFVNSVNQDGVEMLENLLPENRSLLLQELSVKNCAVQLPSCIYPHIRRVSVLELEAAPQEDESVAVNYNRLWEAYMEDDTCGSMRPTQLKVSYTSTTFVEFLCTYAADAPKLTRLAITRHLCFRDSKFRYKDSLRAIVKDTNDAGKIFWGKAIPVHKDYLLHLEVMPGEIRGLDTWWFTNDVAEKLSVCHRLNSLTCGSWATYSRRSIACDFLWACLNKLKTVMSAKFVWGDRKPLRTVTGAVSLAIYRRTTSHKHEKIIDIANAKLTSWRSKPDEGGSRGYPLRIQIAWEVKEDGSCGRCRTFDVEHGGQAKVWALGREVILEAADTSSDATTDSDTASTIPP